MRNRFRDRTDAGRQLAERLRPYAELNPVVLGLPRGGVPVAAEVATSLGAELDVAIVRKLGVPARPELAMGAIGEGGVAVVDRRVMDRARVTEQQLAEVEERERAELNRRAALWRGGRPPVPLAGRNVIIVDDGVATGSTARAACRIAEARNAGRIILAVPVAPPETVAAFDYEVVCVQVPREFLAVGQFYDDFAQITDEQVASALGERRA